jgi:hypothetical protein
MPMVVSHRPNARGAGVVPRSLEQQGPQPTAAVHPSRRALLGLRSYAEGTARTFLELTVDDQVDAL